MKRRVIECQGCGRPETAQLGRVWIFDADFNRSEPKPGEGVHWKDSETVQLHEDCANRTHHLYDWPALPGLGGKAQQLELAVPA